MPVVSTPNPKRSGNPATRASMAGQPTSASRAQVARRSQSLIIRLSQLPRLVIPVTMLVLMLIGLMAPLPLALPALALIVVFVLWLAYISWPALDNRGRLLRGIMLGAVVGAAVGRAVGWL